MYTLLLLSGAGYNGGGQGLNLQSGGYNTTRNVINEVINIQEPAMHGGGYNANANMNMNEGLNMNSTNTVVNRTIVRNAGYQDNKVGYNHWVPG